MPDELDRDGREAPGGGVGVHAIKWSAVVIIVFSVLYFLARYVIPLFG